MEGITPQAMFTTIRLNTQNVSDNDTHIYLYFLMSIHRGPCHNIILFPLNNFQPYFIYDHIILIMPITSFIPPWVYIEPLGYIPRYPILSFLKYIISNPYGLRQNTHGIFVEYSNHIMTWECDLANL